MANGGKVLLQNWNDTKAEVLASDGDSVLLMPLTKTLVEKKFLWNLPKGVSEYKENYTVFGKKPKTVNVTTKSGNLSTSETDRTTLESTSLNNPKT